MIYLDNGATTLHKPPQVMDAVVRAMTAMGNAARGAHGGALEAARTVYNTRVKLARLFGCPRPDHVIFTANSTEALKDGQIDAAFVVAGAPTTAVTSLAATKPVYLVSLDEEHIDALIASSPYYSKNVIAKDVYNTPEDVTTVAVGAVIIARDDCSEDDIYNVCAGIFDSIDTLGHDKKAELDLDFAASITAVPYHAGAAKYFTEKGFNVPTK